MELDRFALHFNSIECIEIANSLEYSYFSIAHLDAIVLHNICMLLVVLLK